MVRKLSLANVKKQELITIYEGNGEMDNQSCLLATQFYPTCKRTIKYYENTKLRQCSSIIFLNKLLLRELCLFN